MNVCMLSVRVDCSGEGAEVHPCSSGNIHVYNEIYEVTTYSSISVHYRSRTSEHQLLFLPTRTLLPRVSKGGKNTDLQ